MPDSSTIVVIGSNSFSGQDFVDLALDDPDCRVIGISRSPEKPDFMLRYKGHPGLDRFRFVQMDMNRDMDDLLDLLDDERPGRVVNFAAQSEVAPSWEHPEQWFQTNTVALARLVRHLSRRDYLGRYLHVSSPEAYGTCSGTVTEETPDNPSTPYAASKAAADLLVSVFHRQFGFPAVTVRATNVYGARQQLFKIVCRAVINIKLGKVIRLDGGGHAVKSYIHVRDVSEGELAMLRHGEAGERYHLSPDDGVSIRELVAIICRRLDVPFADATEAAPERPGQDAVYVIDSTKARRRFAWRPRIALEHGLGECIDWIEANWDAIRTSPLDYLHRP